MDQPNVSADRRIAARTDVVRPVSVVDHDGRLFNAETVNVSTSGMLVAMTGELAIWSGVVAVMPALGNRDARIVRRDEDRYGLVFRQPLSPTEFSSFTGIELPEEPLREPDNTTMPAPRVSPHAFGRDKLRSLRRIASDRGSIQRG